MFYVSLHGVNLLILKNVNRYLRLIGMADSHYEIEKKWEKYRKNCHTKQLWIDINQKLLLVSTITFRKNYSASKNIFVLLYIN